MRKRTDNNQTGIVTLLRSFDMSVQSLASIGRGTPDLLVGYRGQNFLLEIKNPKANPNLTSDETLWHAGWRGQVDVVRDGVEALQLIWKKTGRVK